MLRRIYVYASHTRPKTPCHRALLLTQDKLTNVYYEHLNCRMTTFVRAILITAIFRKSLKLPYDDLKNASALTLMSTDVSGVERLFPLFHDTWSGLAELGIGLYILSTTVGAAAFLTLIPIFSKYHLLLKLCSPKTHSARSHDRHLQLRRKENGSCSCWVE